MAPFKEFFKKLNQAELELETWSKEYLGILPGKLARDVVVYTPWPFGQKFWFVAIDKTGSILNSPEGEGGEINYDVSGEPMGLDLKPKSRFGMKSSGKDKSNELSVDLRESLNKLLTSRISTQAVKPLGVIFDRLSRERAAVLVYQFQNPTEAAIALKRIHERGGSKMHLDNLLEPAGKGEEGAR